MKSLIDYITEQDHRLAYPIGGGDSAKLCKTLEKPDLSPRERLEEQMVFQCEELGYDMNCTTMSFQDMFHIWGLNTYRLDEDGAEYVYPGQIVTDEDLERIGNARTGESPILKEYLNALRAASARTKKPLSIGTFGPLTLAGHLMGVEELLIAMVEEPERVHRLVDAITDVLCAWNGLIEQHGGAFIWVAEPVAVMISAAYFREYSLPYIRRIFASGTQAGFLHVPGNTKHLLSVFCETGAQCLSLDHYMEMQEILKGVSENVVILGNLDSLELLDSEPEVIEKKVWELNEQIQDAPNVIISSGGGISDVCPYENIEPLIRVSHGFPAGKRRQRKPMYQCPDCGVGMEVPICPNCGKQILEEDGVLLFADERLESGKQGNETYLGYTRETCERFPFAETEYYPECSQMLLDIFGKERCYADIGVGFGRVPLQLAKGGANVIAVDISKPVLHLMRQKADEQGISERIQAVCMNAYHLCLADESVDVAVVNNLFMMLGEPQKVVEELKRILKKDGVLAVYARETEFGNGSDRFSCMKRDLHHYFEVQMQTAGYPKVWNDIDMRPVLLQYFQEEEVQSRNAHLVTRSFSEILERMIHNGWNRYQHVPQAVYEQEWMRTDAYAKATYGEAYLHMVNTEKRYSKLILYRKRNESWEE